MLYISDRDIFNYTQCKYRVFHDKNTSAEKASDVGTFMTLMWNMDAIDVENKIARLQSKKDKQFVSITSNDGCESDREILTKKTFRAMKDGVDYIHNAILYQEGEDSLFEQEPGKCAQIPLLLRMQGASSLGDYTYAPALMQSSTGLMQTDWGDRPHPGYQARLNFQASLLQSVLNEPVRKGFVYDMTDSFVPYALSPDDSQLTSIISDIHKMLKGNSAGREPVISSTCDKCPWKQACREIAERDDQLTLLFYLGEKVRDGLNGIGINTIAELADASPEELWNMVSDGKRKGLFYRSFDKALLERLILRAGLSAEQKKRPLDTIVSLYEAPTFPKVEKEIHYDIEDDSLNGFVYLHGFWIREKGKEPEYVALFEDTPDKEKELSEKLWSFFEEHRGTPIYHYSGHEAMTCKKLMKKYNLDVDTYNAVFGEGGTAIDLYEWVVAHSDWPLTSYGLKPLCKYTGFKWSAEDAGGAQSVDWFYAFQAGDDSMKEKILTYNKEDCMATAHLKDWLLAHASEAQNQE